jgi:general secretion pathway protein H
LGSRRGEQARGEAGFTLLELLVVLAILGVMVTIVPNILASLPSAHFKAVTASLADTLRQAHDDAIGSGRIVDVAIDSRERSYAIDGQSPVDLPLAVDSIEVDYEGPGQRGSRSLRFFSDGSATGGRITLRHGQRTAVIRIDWLTGRVRLDD